MQSTHHLVDRLGEGLPHLFGAAGEEDVQGEGRHGAGQVVGGKGGHEHQREEGVLADDDQQVEVVHGDGGGGHGDSGDSWGVSW